MIPNLQPDEELRRAIEIETEIAGLLMWRKQMRDNNADNLKLIVAKLEEYKAIMGRHFND